MADNSLRTPGSGESIATDELTYSGDTVKVQIVRQVKVTGSEGSKTLTELDYNSGNKSDGTPRVVIATDQPAVPVSAASLPLPSGASTLAEQQTQTTALQLIDDTVATLGTTTYTEATTKGLTVGAVRRDADTSAVNTDNELAPLLVNAIGALKVEIFDGGDSHTVDGTVSVSGTVTVDLSTNNDVTVSTAATGGASTINSTSSDGGTALTNSAQAIKASAGSLVGYFIYNANSQVAYVQFYNTAQGSVTVGTTNPLFMLAIPPSSAANLWMVGGIAFGTAMSWAATSTAGGNGALSTSLDAVCWYV